MKKFLILPLLFLSLSGCALILGLAGCTNDTMTRQEYDSIRPMLDTMPGIN